MASARASSAFALFVERARAVVPQFALGTDAALWATSAAASAACGVPLGISLALYGKGTAFAHVNRALALARFECSRAIAIDVGNRWAETLVLPDLAALHAGTGDPAKVLSTYLEMLLAWRGATDLAILGGGLGNLVALFERLGHWSPAATVSGKLTSKLDFAAFAPGLAAALLKLRTALGDNQFDEAVGHGGAMTLSDAIAYAEAQVRASLVTTREESGGR